MDTAPRTPAGRYGSVPADRDEGDLVWDAQGRGRTGPDARPAGCRRPGGVTCAWSWACCSWCSPWRAAPASSRASTTPTPVHAAARDLLPGQPLRDGDLVTVQVRLADATEHYLDASDPVPDGTYLLRRVTAGELLPAAAVGTQRQALDKTVNVPVEGSAVPGCRWGRRSTSG